MTQSFLDGNHEIGTLLSSTCPDVIVGGELIATLFREGGTIAGGVIELSARLWTRQPTATLGPAYAAGAGHWGTQVLVPGSPQHPLVSTQAEPGGQAALVVQGVAVPLGGAQKDPAMSTHTILPSLLWLHQQLDPHGVPNIAGQNTVNVAGQVLLGKQVPA
jgi:hypothetical protein